MVRLHQRMMGPPSDDQLRVVQHLWVARDGEGRRRPALPQLRECADDQDVDGGRSNGVTAGPAEPTPSATPGSCASMRRPMSSGSSCLRADLLVETWPYDSSSILVGWLLCTFVHTVVECPFSGTLARPAPTCASTEWTSPMRLGFSRTRGH